MAGKGTTSFPKDLKKLDGGGGDELRGPVVPFHPSPQALGIFRVLQGRPRLNQQTHQDQGQELLLLLVLRPSGWFLLVKWESYSSWFCET